MIDTLKPQKMNKTAWVPLQPYILKHQKDEQYNFQRFSKLLEYFLHTPSVRNHSQLCKIFEQKRTENQPQPCKISILLSRFIIFTSWTMLIWARYKPMAWLYIKTTPLPFKKQFTLASVNIVKMATSWPHHTKCMEDCNLIGKEKSL